MTKKRVMPTAYVENGDSRIFQFFPNQVPKSEASELRKKVIEIKFSTDGQEVPTQQQDATILGKRDGSQYCADVG